jgi:hypothetical protein
VTKLGGSRLGVALAIAGLCAVGHAGCGSDEKDLLTKPYDAGADTAPEAAPDGPDVDPTLGGPCSEDRQCDDGIPCTFDRCDLALSRCRNTPDDSQCQDPTYCNGKERCVLRKGCSAGPVVTCQDDDPCTIDKCIEADKSCVHGPRDVDGDGDPDDHCIGSKDCDDTDPTVSSARAEICGNGKDDNCNGSVDEQPCARPANDTCVTALTVTAPGTYLLTSVAAKKDYVTSCTVKTPAAAKDVVVGIRAPGNAGDPPKDIDVWATSQLASNEVAIALETECGFATSELSCGHVDGSSSARAIARSVPAGSLVWAIVTTQTESAVDLKVDFRDATTKPANESCAAPQPVALDTPFTVSIIDPSKDLASGCDKAKTGELTYAFTLAQPQDVRIFASTLVGPGQPVVTMRDATCGGELRCRVGQTPPVFARSLPAGTYVFGVAGTTQLDASILVKTYPPTSAPPNQSCATAPLLVANTSITVDLSGQEDAIQNGCLPGGPAAAYDLEITEPSDVLVVGRFPQTEVGAVAINGPGCTTSDRLACSTGTTPARASRRNLAPGSYRVVIADEQGATGAQLAVYVRPTVPPATVGGSDGCATAFPIPATGGFFVGDTTAMTADFDAGCDAPGMPIGGAKDQMLRLDLAQPRRVVFDMSGSFYTTLLDIRRGTACPGTEVPGACYVGAGPQRSFLDLALAAGTYWVQVDGYSGDRGPWSLDVRVLPP